MNRSSQTLTNLLAVYSFDPSGVHKASGAGRTKVPVPTTLASVVVVSRNSRNHLETCLNSLMHTVGLNSEIIVVDDASVDGSPDYVAESFPWVRLARNKTPLGLASATNQGVALARGRFLVVLDAATEVSAGWLEALLAPLQEDASTGITTPRILRVGPSGDVIACGNLARYSGPSAGGASKLPGAGALPAVNGTCFALSRELWQQLGGLHSSFAGGTQETDLSLRARLAGYRCAYVPEAVVHHNYSGSLETSRRLYLMERSRLLMLLKAYQHKSLRQLVPKLVVAEMVGWRHAASDRPKHAAAKLRAYRWLLANRKEIARTRRKTREGGREVVPARKGR